MKYKIYEKKAGDKDPRELEFDSFTVRNHLAIPIKASDELAAFGLLNLENVAAIIPDNPQELQRSNTSGLAPFGLNVFLKGKSDPLLIDAQSIDTSQGDLSFCQMYVDLNAQPMVRHVPIPNIYVALSEVVMVVPSGGLPDRNIP
jgi:hypothetical protein